MSLRAVIEGAGLTLPACASALGVDPEIFQQWADAQREMPPAYSSVLASVLGIKPEVITSKALSAGRGAAKIEPAAIWFKFKGETFTDMDREIILLIRRLGHNANQFEKATRGQANRAWTLLFQSIMEQIDLQASPQDQGRMAAQAFSALTQFGKGGTGAAEYLRGSLRSQGILVIESPLQNSRLEGCSFLVGDAANQRPCVFVNTFKTTWFRRNVTIMHEIGHALFDHTSPVEIDFDEGEFGNRHADKSLKEVRVQSFAKECLLPKRLILSFCSQNGTQANKLTHDSLAALVAFSGVEKKTVTEVLRDHDLIDEALATQYEAFDISNELRSMSDHALSTKEYVKKIGLDAARLWIDKRATTMSTTRLLLPVSYVEAVLSAVKNFLISIGRAAELLMIDEDVFYKRFPEVVAGIQE